MEIDRSQFSKFDFKDLPHNFSAAIYGKRRTGKSVIVRDFMYHLKDWYSNIYLFSETIHLQPGLYNFIPKQNQFNKFDQDRLQQIWNHQEQYIQKNTGKDKKTLNHVMVIFDDVINDKNIRNSEILNRFHISGRHINLASIILSQNVGGKWGINGVCRNNEDLIVAFFPKAAYDRELIVKQYLSVISNKIGDEILRTLTQEDFNAIVIENHKTDQDYTKFVKWYMAEEKTPDFTIGDSMDDIPQILVKIGPEKVFKPKGVNYRIVSAKGEVYEIKNPQKTQKEKIATEK